MTLRHRRETYVGHPVPVVVWILLGALGGATAAIAGVVLAVGFWGGAGA